jgi:hypothetical protein
MLEYFLCGCQVIIFFDCMCQGSSKAVFIVIPEVSELTAYKNSRLGIRTSWEHTAPSEVGEYYQCGDQAIKMNIKAVTGN